MYIVAISKGRRTQLPSRARSIDAATLRAEVDLAPIGAVASGVPSAAQTWHAIDVTGESLASEEGSVSFGQSAEATQVASAAVMLMIPALFLVVATPSQARTNADPPGNDGTVKVDGVLFDSAPDNQPHVGCDFQIDFYGFDQGVGDATVTFELQAPTLDGRTLTVTGGDLTPNIGQDPAGGGTDVDAQETYHLAFTGDPQPQQGYHVKVTVDAPGSIGADTKFKTFFVTGCAPTTTTAMATTTTTAMATTTTAPAIAPGVAQPASPVPGSPSFTG